MQTSHLDDELLQRHFDGELDRAQAEKADAHLQSCAVCSGKIDGLAQLSSLVAMNSEDQLKSADLAGLFARVEQGIAADGGSAKVVSFADAASARKKRAFGASSALLAGLAAAAAVVLMVYRPGASNPTPDAELPADGPTIAPAPPPAQATTAAAPAANPPSGSEIVQVDFGNNAGTVFDIALSDGSSTTVIWINDE